MLWLLKTVELLEIVRNIKATRHFKGAKVKRNIEIFKVLKI